MVCFYKWMFAEDLKWWAKSEEVWVLDRSTFLNIVLFMLITVHADGLSVFFIFIFFFKL